jgi:hypothetical protein
VSLREAVKGALNVRNSISIVVLVVAFLSFVSLVSLPVPVSTTLTSVGLTWSPYMTETVVDLRTSTQESLIFEPYTQVITTSRLVVAFQAGQNNTSLALLCTLVVALIVLATTLLMDQSKSDSPRVGLIQF